MFWKWHVSKCCTGKVWKSIIIETRKSPGIWYFWTLERPGRQWWSVCRNLGVVMICDMEFVLWLHCRCIENMIRQAQLESKGTRQKVLSYIGMVFRHSLQAPDWYLDTAVANFLIKYVSTYIPCIQIKMWQSLHSNSTTFELRMYSADSKFVEIFHVPSLNSNLRSLHYRRHMTVKLNGLLNLICNAWIHVNWQYIRCSLISGPNWLVSLLREFH